MIKYFLAAASVILLAVSHSPSKADTETIPPEKRFSSTLGEVIFQHQKHIREHGIKCPVCHHPVIAKKLDTPHPAYFRSSPVDCKVCHNDSEKTKKTVYTCSGCHRSNPISIADETLSSKVVIHKMCWDCHEVGTDKESSKLCKKCHSGEKRS